jgi:hypothetical protein
LSPSGTRREKAEGVPKGSGRAGFAGVSFMPGMMAGGAPNWQAPCPK